MTYLLDTHCFLWAVFDSQRLSSTVRDLLTDTDNRVVISTVSFWEISLKSALGKLELVGCLPEELPEIALQMGLECMPLEPDHAASFYQLPRQAHKDPFDRMLVWLAIKEQWTLISKDQHLVVYQSHGLELIW